MVERDFVWFYQRPACVLWQNAHSDFAQDWSKEVLRSRKSTKEVYKVACENRAFWDCDITCLGRRQNHFPNLSGLPDPHTVQRWPTGSISNWGNTETQEGSGDLELPKRLLGQWRGRPRTSGHIKGIGMTLRKISWGLSYYTTWGRKRTPWVVVTS